MKNTPIQPVNRLNFKTISYSTAIEKNIIPTFTWNNKWKSSFESPWGIIEKIKFYNNISSKDFISHFGTEKKTKNFTVDYKNLIDLPKINDELFMSHFKFSLKAHNLNALSHLLAPLYDGLDKPYDYLNKQLLFCPSCIKNGYHSIFHQAKFTNKCPFHNEKLVQVCNKCSTEGEYHYKKQLQYEIKISNSFLTFECTCGSSFFDDKNEYFPTFFAPEKEDIQNEEIKRWISLSESEKKEISKYHYLKKNDILYSEKFIPQFLNVVKISNKKTFTSIKGTFTLSHSYTNKQSKVTNCSDNAYIRHNHEIYNYIYYSSLDTINALARKIRKEITKNHKYCVIRMKNVMVNKTTGEKLYCPIANAYLQWRYLMQNYNWIWKIDNYGHFYKKINYDCLTVEGSEEDNTLLDNFTHEIKNYLYDKDSTLNISALSWLINRSISHIAINHFNNILKASCQNEDYFASLYTDIKPFILMKETEKWEYHWVGGSTLVNIRNFDRYCDLQGSQKKIKDTEVRYMNLSLNSLDRDFN